MRTILNLLFIAAAARVGQACQNTPVIWTIYTNYTDAATGLAMTPQITGDGVQTDGAGNTVYVPGSGVLAHLNVCGTNPTYDATLNVSRTRTFNMNLGLQLGNDYGQYPPSYSFMKENGLLNIRDIMWCQHNGYPNGCTFYTKFTSQVTGSDRNIYHLRMENPSTSNVSPGPNDATANCPYVDSAVQVVFTPGALNASGKDTYVVTPVLQGANTGSGWTAPAVNSGCPAATLPAGTWPAAVSVLILDGTGDSYNFGQYDTPFKFVIQNQ